MCCWCWPAAAPACSSPTDEEQERARIGPHDAPVGGVTKALPLRSSLARAAAVTVLGLLLAAAPWTAASAHSELRASVPAAGAQLRESPPRIELRFNEPVQLTALRVLDARGSALRIERETGLEARSDAAARLPRLAPGRYRIVWAAISADGHPVSGTVRFELLAPPDGAPAVTAPK